MPKPDHPAPMFDAADEEVTRYRAVSSLALAGLLAGLLSPLAMWTAVLWLVPLAAVAVSGLALRRIAIRWPELAGRPAAWAGLFLGTTFLVAAPVDDFLYRYYVRQQARQFAEIWIDAVRNGEVLRAHHLMLDPRQRHPLDSNLAVYYRQNEKWRRMLNLWRNEPTMRTLFALGPKAEIRFYETAAEGADFAQLTYAVTYPDEEQELKTKNAKKTFFITLLMQRSIETGSRRANWTLLHVDGGVRPRGW